MSKEINTITVHVMGQYRCRVLATLGEKITIVEKKKRNKPQITGTMYNITIP